MFENTVVRGIVLDTSLIKEYDKRLLILTVELGRITVFANGARRKNSSLTAVSQKFVMGSFTIRPSGRESYALISAEIEESFLDLSYDIEKMAYASYFCELAGHYTREGIGATDELNLLYVTFKKILSDRFSLKFIKSVFECKLLDIEGMGLQMYECVKTQTDKDLHHISLEDGGLVTDAVLSSTKSPIYISDGAIYMIRYILSCSIDRVYSFEIKQEIADEVALLMDKYISLNADRHFKSLDILVDIME